MCISISVGVDPYHGTGLLRHKTTVDAIRAVSGHDLQLKQFGCDPAVLRVWSRCAYTHVRACLAHDKLGLS